MGCAFFKREINTKLIILLDTVELYDNEKKNLVLCCKNHIIEVDASINTYMLTLTFDSPTIATKLSRQLENALP